MPTTLSIFKRLNNSPPFTTMYISPRIKPINVIKNEIKARLKIYPRVILLRLTGEQ